MLWSLYMLSCVIFSYVYRYNHSPGAVSNDPSDKGSAHLSWHYRWQLLTHTLFGPAQAGGPKGHVPVTRQTECRCTRCQYHTGHNHHASPHLVNIDQINHITCPIKHNLRLKFFTQLQASPQLNTIYIFIIELLKSHSWVHVLLTFWVIKFNPSSSIWFNSAALNWTFSSSCFWRFKVQL